MYLNFTQCELLFRSQYTALPSSGTWLKIDVSCSRAWHSFDNRSEIHAGCRSDEYQAVSEEQHATSFKQILMDYAWLYPQSTQFVQVLCSCWKITRSWIILTSLVEGKKPSALLVTLAMLFNFILPCDIKLKQWIDISIKFLLKFLFLVMWIR